MLLFALGLVLSAVPVPQVEFLEASVGHVVPLPAVRDAGAEELAEMDSQMEDHAAAEVGEDDATEVAGDDATEPADVAVGQDDHDHELGEHRVIGTDGDSGGFSMIGVNLDEATDEPVLVRVRAAGGTWGEWTELEQNTDEGPDAGSDERAGVGTEPLWVDNADAYQISVPESAAGGADVTLVRDEQRRVVTEAVPLADASTPPPFAIKSRSTWNARASRDSNYASTVKLALVHHTVSTNSYTPGQVPGILRSIQAYHMDGRGWDDIGYNFLVDRYGTVWEGRGGGITRPVIGAHAAGFNSGSVGVALIGDHSISGPTSNSLEGVARVIGWKLYSSRTDPRSIGTYTSAGSSSIPAGRVVSKYVVSGHRDVGSTSCPGSTTYAQLGFIKNRAFAWYNATAAQRNPFGSLDEVRVDGSTITVRGWAADPDSGSPVSMHTVVGDIWKISTANKLRLDIAKAYPALGGSRGYQVTYTNVPPGTYKVCAYAINQGEGNANSGLGCRDVVVK